jgi:hypothetical protein
MAFIQRELELIEERSRRQISRADPAGTKHQEASDQETAL